MPQRVSCITILKSPHVAITCAGMCGLWHCEHSFRICAALDRTLSRVAHVLTCHECGVQEVGACTDLLICPHTHAAKAFRGSKLEVLQRAEGFALLAGTWYSVGGASCVAWAMLGSPAHTPGGWWFDDLE